MKMSFIEYNKNLLIVIIELLKSMRNDFTEEEYEDIYFSLSESMEELHQVYHELLERGE